MFAWRSCGATVLHVEGLCCVSVEPRLCLCLVVWSDELHSSYVASSNMKYYIIVMMKRCIQRLLSQCWALKSHCKYARGTSAWKCWHFIIFEMYFKHSSNFRLGYCHSLTSVSVYCIIYVCKTKINAASIGVAAENLLKQMLLLPLLQLRSPQIAKIWKN